MKTDKFARGGKQKMFGKGSHTRTSYPAQQQRPGRTGQQSTKPAPKRRPGRAPVDVAGDSGGSPAASMPRRPAA